MKYLIFFIVSLIGISCNETKSRRGSNLARQDSIFSEFSKLVVMSYVWNDSKVMDEVLIDLDTIEVTRDHEIPAYLEHGNSKEHELIKIKKGFHLLPTEEIPRLTRLNVFKVKIYDWNFQFVGDGICSPELLIEFREPDIGQQKSEFYDRQKLLVERAHRVISEKYDIPEDTLDKIIFLRLQSERNDSIMRQFLYSQ